MKKIILISSITLLFCTSCASLLGRNQGQGQDGSQQSNNSGKNSFLSSLFGTDDNEPQNNNRGNNSPSEANLNLKSDSSRLPTSFQQPRKYPKQDMMAVLSPLHLTRIEGNTWRTAANPVVVYGIMARLLSQTYIISSVDRKNFNIQTDWDKFFIDGHYSKITVLKYLHSDEKAMVLKLNRIG